MHHINKQTLRMEGKQKRQVQQVKLWNCESIQEQVRTY